MLDRLIAFFFPDRCAFCGKVLHYCRNGICICPRCLQSLHFLDEVDTCTNCGRPVSGPGELCETCQTHRHYFSRAFSCLVYKDAVRTAVLRFKFGGRRDLYRTFGNLIALLTMPQHRNIHFDLVVYPPISKKAYRERGYNQAFYLAQQVSRRLSVPLCKDAFRKLKETPKQSTLHYSDRFENVSGAFALSVSKEIIQGKIVLLVDDVLTTGATVDALAKLLRSAKADSVYVATLAVTQFKQEGLFSEEEINALRY